MGGLIAVKATAEKMSKIFFRLGLRALNKSVPSNRALVLCYCKKAIRVIQSSLLLRVKGDQFVGKI
jgi:hypothetical protein